MYKSEFFDKSAFLKHQMYKSEFFISISFHQMLCTEVSILFGDLSVTYSWCESYLLSSLNVVETISMCMHTLALVNGRICWKQFVREGGDSHIKKTF